MSIKIDFENITEDDLATYSFSKLSCAYEQFLRKKLDEFLDFANIFDYKLELYKINLNAAEFVICNDKINKDFINFLGKSYFPYIFGCCSNEIYAPEHKILFLCDSSFYNYNNFNKIVITIKDNPNRLNELGFNKLGQQGIPYYTYSNNYTSENAILDEYKKIKRNILTLQKKISLLEHLIPKLKENI